MVLKDTRSLSTCDLVLTTNLLRACCNIVLSSELCCPNKRSRSSLLLRSCLLHCRPRAVLPLVVRYYGSKGLLAELDSITCPAKRTRYSARTNCHLSGLLICDALELMLRVTFHVSNGSGGLPVLRRPSRGRNPRLSKRMVTTSFEQSKLLNSSSTTGVLFCALASCRSNHVHASAPSGS